MPVSFQELFDNLQGDTLLSLRSFAPELTLCGTIVVLLLTRLFRLTGRISPFLIALVGSAKALYFATYPYHQSGIDLFGLATSDLVALPSQGAEFFTGMLVYDNLTVFFRALLLLFVVLFLLFTRLTGVPDRETGPDFYTLLLGATLGMCLMASANHLLMVFLGVEMASVPSYALAGLLKGRRQSSEAALKYAVFGAGAAGVMLYGISLLAGALGTAHIPTLAVQLAERLGDGSLSAASPVLVLGGLMIAVGLAFKLSAVPFHFWCPDVFEGATAEVNAFLSVASKAAALALLVRVALGVGYVPAPHSPLALADPPAAVGDAETSEVSTDAANPVLRASSAEQIRNLAPVRTYTFGLIVLLSAVTCTFGNLAAYGQTNIKRLLAYSTIAHAGYLMMPVAAAIAVVGHDAERAEAAIGSLCFYIAVYLFMNLGAFAVVAFLRNALRSEEVADYAGLIRRAPGVVVIFSLLLLSLLGLPPLAGFPAKVFIFSALVDAAQVAPEYRTELLTLFVIGGLNTVLSLFYYLRVVKVMTLDPEPDSRLPVEVPLASLSGAFLVALALPVAVFGVWFNDLREMTLAAASQFLS